MTETEKTAISAYIPSSLDEELEDDEYYILDNNRVQRVRISDISQTKDGRTDYGVRLSGTGKRLLRGGNPYSVTMAKLYDNKEDCRKQTHPAYDNWEHLRFLQRMEGMI